VPATLYASARGGTRYHRDQLCTGLTSTLAAGDPVPTVTRAQCLTRKLLPCAICRPSQVTTMALVP
jgi:hypothetical protein